jgi:hypothetical protein
MKNDESVSISERSVNKEKSEKEIYNSDKYILNEEYIKNDEYYHKIKGNLIASNDLKSTIQFRSINDQKNPEDKILSLNLPKRTCSLFTKEGYKEDKNDNNVSRNEEQKVDVKSLRRRSMGSMHNTTNVNININIKHVSPRSRKTVVYEKNEMLESEISSRNDVIIPKKMQIHNGEGSPSRRWKKISNLFRSLNSLSKYETKNLENESDLDFEMRDYKDRLFNNTIRIRNSAMNERKSLFDSRTIRLIKMVDEGKMNYKEEIYKIIVEGDIKSVKKIDMILKQDPEYYLFEVKDPCFTYNTPLPNGKTLIYMACLEGKVDIVKFLLDKKWNAKIKSNVDNNDGESPLQVSARWNYLNIVKLLLEKVDYSKHDIKEALNLQGIAKGVKVVLKKYIYSRFGKTSFNCYC